MKSRYHENGYFVIRNLFTVEEISIVSEVLIEFHELWMKRNLEYYTKGIINSAYITGTEYLDQAKRNLLFQFIGSSKLMTVVSNILPQSHAAFMNTQLFFDPMDKEQKNYWHRDPQYNLSLDQQKEALNGPEVIHFRIPLVDEPGIELVPKSHKNWDSEEELDVRLQRNNLKNCEDLSTGYIVELNAGDLLVFSANIIHRGLYGMDRLSLDILFCEPERSLSQFINEDCLPSRDFLENIENPSAFMNTLKLKAER